MKGSPVLWFAIRSFFSRKDRKKATRPLLGAVIGIALSLVPLTVVIHLSEGMIEGITRRYIETYTWHLQVFSYLNVSTQEVEDVAESLMNLDRVRSVIIERQGVALAYAGNEDMGVTVRGLPPTLYEEDEAFREYLQITAGEFSLEEKGDIVLGQFAASRLGVGVGDEVRILTGRTFGSGRFVPKLSRFTVRGIFTTGYEELDRLWVLVSLEDAERILSEDDAHSLVGMKIDNPMNRPEELVGKIVRDLPPGWYVHTWKDLNGSQQKNFQTTQTILVVIMIMLVMVAVINVSSSLVMLVLERQQQIGILKCTGTSPRDIKRIFILIGLLAGVAGTLSGLSLGTLLSLTMNQIIAALEAVINLLWHWGGQLTGREQTAIKLVNTAYYLEQVPVTFQAVKVLVVGILTVSLATAASAVPAIRAGKVRPLEVIRKH